MGKKISLSNRHIFSMHRQFRHFVTHWEPGALNGSSRRDAEIRANAGALPLKLEPEQPKWQDDHPEPDRAPEKPTKRVHPCCLAAEVACMNLRTSWQRASCRATGVYYFTPSSYAWAALGSSLAIACLVARQQPKILAPKGSEYSSYHTWLILLSFSASGRTNSTLSSVACEMNILVSGFICLLDAAIACLDRQQSLVSSAQ